MQNRQLGAAGPRVSALGLGVMPLSMGRTPAVPREQGIETVHAALDALGYWGERPGLPA